MEQDKTISTPLSRVTVLDALRGFALLGVILMHMLQHYSIFSLSGADGQKPMFPASDEIIQWIGQNVITGRFINIFAFLFGLSFFIQMDRSARKGIDFRKRFIWRMSILFIIGQIGNCFYSGEIMSLYAVFGVILVFLYKVRGWILMVIFSLLLLGTPRILKTNYDKTVKTERSENTANARGGSRRTSVMYEGREKPSFLKSVKHNFTSGLAGKLNYQFGIFGRGYLTLALFILGLVVGRTGYFEKVSALKKKNLMLFAGFAIAFIAVIVVQVLLPVSNLFELMRAGEDIPLSLLLQFSLNDISTVLFSGAVVMGFILIYNTEGLGKYLDVMSPYGRMGLTNYEVQSVIGCFLFSMWAFGSFFGKLGATEVFVLGIILYIIQLLFSRYWLKHFLYGPLEWLWRSATYLKSQSFRKKQE